MQNADFLHDSYNEVNPLRKKNSMAFKTFLFAWFKSTLLGNEKERRPPARSAVNTWPGCPALHQQHP